MWYISILQINAFWGLDKWRFLSDFLLYLKAENETTMGIKASCLSCRKYDYLITWSETRKSLGFKPQGLSCQWWALNYDHQPTCTILFVDLILTILHVYCTHVCLGLVAGVFTMYLYYPFLSVLSRRKKLDEIKQRKLSELRAVGIPEKYCAEVSRRITAPAPSFIMSQRH